MPRPAAAAALIGLGVFSTALAYVLYFRILSTAGATNVLMVTFLPPVSAMALGVFILNETIRMPQLAGAAFIATGLAAVDGRAWRYVLRLNVR